MVAEFIVDGTKIPDVDFDIGESYAGLIPISNATNAGKLYFWFFPTSNPNGTEDLTIWLNASYPPLPPIFSADSPIGRSRLFISRRIPPGKWSLLVAIRHLQTRQESMVMAQSHEHDLGRATRWDRFLPRQKHRNESRGCCS